MSDKHVVAALQRSVADLELRLIEVVRERDQAYDDRNRARAERDLVRSAWAGAEESLIAEREHAERLANERDEARALLLKVMDTGKAALREIAERQREACADFVRLWRLDAKLGAIAWHSEDAVRATPLVTEVEK